MGRPLSSRKKTIKTSTTIIGLHLYLVVEDIMAGHKNRFTVHQVQLAGAKHSKVIGYSVTPGVAKKLIQRAEGISPS